MHPSTPPGLGEVQLLTSQTNQIEETLLCKWIHSVIHAQLSEKTFCALRLFGVMSPTVHSFKSLKTSPEEQTATEMTALTVHSPATGQGCRCPPCQQFRSPTVLRIGCLIFVGSVTCHVAQLDEGGRGQAWPELHPGGRRGSLYVVCLCWRALQGTPRLSQTERAFLCYLSGWRCSHF